MSTMRASFATFAGAADMARAISFASVCEAAWARWAKPASTKAVQRIFMSYLLGAALSKIAADAPLFQGR